MINKFKALNKYLRVFIVLVVIGLCSLAVLSVYVSKIAEEKIITIQELDTADAALVLGCGIANGQPSPMLRNRLDAAIKLYNKAKVSKIYLSGFKDGEYYDEVQVMNNYCLKKGVPSADIIQDKKGQDTFKSVSNIEKSNFKSYVIVTQDQHLKRAIFISSYVSAKQVYGFAADDIPHTFAMFRMNSREVLARVKVFYDIITEL